LNAASGAFLLLLALVAANLPFLFGRPRGAWWRIAGLVAAYFAVGIVARLLEARSGAIYAQGWEFYAVTACLFLVLAFPGFVYRYLWKHHS
jgi:hypothetical protein